jgi:cytochrome P450
MNTARWHEFLVYCLNRPLAYAILELSRRLGDVVHIPRIGYIVNDAEIAREVLTDGAHFDSHSPGSLGVLITQVLGPHALLNMDGAEHKELKRRLMEVFSPRYIDTLLDAATADLVQEFRGALVAGRSVDVVEFMKHFASRLACELIGVTIEPRDEHRAYADMFDLATKFTALAGLGKRQLGPRELTTARDIVGRLAAHVRGSYEDVRHRDRSLTQQMRARDFSFDEVQGVVIIVMIGATELITYGLPRVLALLIDSGQITKVRRDLASRRGDRRGLPAGHAVQRDPASSRRRLRGPRPSVPQRRARVDRLPQYHAASAALSGAGAFRSRTAKRPSISPLDVRRRPAHLPRDGSGDRRSPQGPRDGVSTRR